MTSTVERTISRMSAGLVTSMIAAIERDLEINTRDTESRRNNLEILVALRGRQAELDFAARQTTMFDDWFQLEGYK